MNCKYCNKNQQDHIICCLWDYYANNNKYSDKSQRAAEAEGFVEWVEQNKEEISGITKRAEELSKIK